MVSRGTAFKNHLLVLNRRPLGFVVFIIANLYVIFVFEKDTFWAA